MILDLEHSTTNVIPKLQLLKNVSNIILFQAHLSLHVGIVYGHEGEDSQMPQTVRWLQASVQENEYHIYAVCVNDKPAEKCSFNVSHTYTIKC